MIPDYYFYLGDSINPFDDELITKLLQRVIKFPNEHHKSGYVEYESDLPYIRPEFKLGMYNLYNFVKKFHLCVVMGHYRSICYKLSIPLV